LAHGNHTLSTTEAEGEATTIKSGTPAPQPADIVESTVKPFAWDQILNLGESSSVELKLPRIEVEAVEEPTELSQKVNETVNRPVDSEFASEPEEVEADKGKGTAADVEHHGDATITNNNASLTESHEQMSADESEKQEAEVVEGEPKDTQSESIEHEEIALTQAGNGVTEDNAPRILCRGDSPRML
jgi:hypothetical protein